MDCCVPGSSVLHSLLEFAQIYVHGVRDAIQPSHLLLLSLLLLPSVLSSIKVFFSESALHIRWPKYRSFNFSISPSNEYSRLISFRIDWLDLFAIQRALKILLQHHFESTNLKASILWCLTFLMEQFFISFYLPWSNGIRCHDLSFLMLSFKSAFSLSSFNNSNNNNLLVVLS